MKYSDATIDEDELLLVDSMETGELWREIEGSDYVEGATGSWMGRWRLLPTWVCALASVHLLAMVLSLALHVRVGLGHWPQPMIENYNSPAFRLHDSLFGLSALATVYGAAPVWLLLLCFRRLRGSLRLHLLQAGVYAAGWGLIALYAWIDPGRFVTWLLD